MSAVSLVPSRFSVFRGKVRLGVIVPRSDGWAFVSCSGSFATYYGKSPEEAIMNAGYHCEEVSV